MGREIRSMSERRDIDAERLAALLDGRLQEAERDALLAELAAHDDGAGALGDVAAVLRDLEAAGAVPAEDLRAPPIRRQARSPLRPSPCSTTCRPAPPPPRRIVRCPPHRRRIPCARCCAKAGAWRLRCSARAMPPRERGSLRRAWRRPVAARSS